MLYSTLVDKFRKHEKPAYKGITELLEEGNYLPIHNMDINEVINRDVPPETISDLEIMMCIDQFLTDSYHAHKRNISLVSYKNVKKVFSFHRENILKAFVNYEAKNNNVPCVGITIPFDMSGRLADAYIVFSASEKPSFHAKVFAIQRNIIRNKVKNLIKKANIKNDIIASHAYCNINSESYIFNFVHFVEIYGNNSRMERIKTLRVSNEEDYVQYGPNGDRGNNYLELEADYRNGVKRSYKWVISGVGESNFSGKLIISKDDVNINPINLDNAFIYKYSKTK